MKPGDSLRHMYRHWSGRYRKYAVLCSRPPLQCVRGRVQADFEACRPLLLLFCMFDRPFYHRCGAAADSSAGLKRLAMLAWQVCTLCYWSSACIWLGDYYCPVFPCLFHSKLAGVTGWKLKLQCDLRNA